MKRQNINLIAKRIESSMTQADVARLAGISTRGYQQYESDASISPNIRTAIRISDALHVENPRQLWDINLATESD